MTRTEHLAWCKERALEYVEAGKLHEAFASMVSDLGKHEDTKTHNGMMRGARLWRERKMNTPAKMKRWIESIL